jgi:hypothetical protein
MNENELTQIIAADFMYLSIIGSREIIDRLVTKLNKDAKKNNTKKQYITTTIDTPCAEMLESPIISQMLIDDCMKDINEQNNLINSTSEKIAEYIDERKKYIGPDEGIESAQSLIYAENCDEQYMLMEINNNKTHFVLSFPVLHLGEEVNPDELISAWIMNNNVSSVANDLSIRPVGIVGTKHDILVFMAIINHDDD